MLHHLDLHHKFLSLLFALSFHLLITNLTFAADLAEIRQKGVLRHLGITYANFVKQTNDGHDGLDVELIRLFANHIGVRYEFVETTWSTAFGDLTGQYVLPEGNEVKIVGTTAVRGDILANGLTILPWRKQVVNYSIPTFPTGVWLIARANSSMKPIQPTGDIAIDIRTVMSLLAGRSVLTMKGTCLDPGLYHLGSSKAEIRLFTDSESLNDIAPAVMKGAAEATLLDIPDALVALEKWPGKIKVIGPISHEQAMGVAFAKSSPALLEAFNEFFQARWKDGTYEALVRKYYPSVFVYLGGFFSIDKYSAEKNGPTK